LDLKNSTNGGMAPASQILILISGSSRAAWEERRRVRLEREKEVGRYIQTNISLYIERDRKKEGGRIATKGERESEQLFKKLVTKVAG